MRMQLYQDARRRQLEMARLGQLGQEPATGMPVAQAQLTSEIPTAVPVRGPPSHDQSAVPVAFAHPVMGTAMPHAGGGAADHFPQAAPVQAAPPGQSAPPVVMARPMPGSGGGAQVV